jgi:hypothetical protein
MSIKTDGDEGKMSNIDPWVSALIRRTHRCGSTTGRRRKNLEMNSVSRSDRESLLNRPGRGGRGRTLPSHSDKARDRLSDVD